MFKIGDIDIDVSDREEVLSNFSYVSANILECPDFKKHNSGVYFQAIPRNIENNISLINYKRAQDMGYYKIDLLNNSVYRKIHNNIEEFLDKEPNWDLLQDKEVVSKLYHISNYYDLINRLKPDSVEKLAAIISLIRPGKKHLRNCTWDVILSNVWVDDGNSTTFFFKKSHSIAYSLVICLQLNLIEAGVL